LIHAGEIERPSAGAMALHRQFESASWKKLDKLREDSSTLVHPPMIKARSGQRSSKLTIEIEIVYPNENNNPPQGPIDANPNQLAEPDNSGFQPM
jgi:hypothetical protein